MDPSASALRIVHRNRGWLRTPQPRYHTTKTHSGRGLCELAAMQQSNAACAKKLVVSWHLLFLQGGSNEAAKVLNFDQWLGDRLAVVSYCAAVPPSLIARADEVIE